MNDYSTEKAIKILFFIVFGMLGIIAIIFGIEYNSQVQYHHPHYNYNKYEIYDSELFGTFVDRTTTDDRSRIAIIVQLKNEKIVFDWHSYNTGFYSEFEFGDTIIIEKGFQHMRLHKVNGERIIGIKWRGDDWDKIIKPIELEEGIRILNE